MESSHVILQAGRAKTKRMNKENNKKSTLVESLSFQESYNDRFGCCICLGPKLRMVTGHCQHRICEECLYEGPERRQCMQNCPICSYTESFPRYRPVIPTSTIEMQVCLGVQKCPKKGCTAQLWFWEVDEHLKNCDTECKSTPNKKIKLCKNGNEKAKSATPSRSILSPRRRRHQSENSNYGNMTILESALTSHAISINSRNQRQPNLYSDQISTSSGSDGTNSRVRSQQSLSSGDQRRCLPNSDEIGTSSLENKNRSGIIQNLSTSRRHNNLPTEPNMTTSLETSHRMNQHKGQSSQRQNKETDNRLDTLRRSSRSCKQDDSNRALSPVSNRRSHTVTNRSRSRGRHPSGTELNMRSSGEISRRSCSIVTPVNSPRVLRNNRQVDRR